MKKLKLLLFVVITLLLSSCAPKITRVNYYQDFLDFYDNDFFVTVSNSVPFEYIPVGYIILTDENGYIYTPSTEVQDRSNVAGNENTEGIYYNPNKERKLKWERATSYSALTEIKKMAATKGADGILDVRIVPVFSSDKSTVPYGYRVSGMLFKRKN